MKYMMLIHQGTTPLPGTPKWDALSPEEQQQVYADYRRSTRPPASRPASGWARPRPRPPSASTTARR